MNLDDLLGHHVYVIAEIGGNHDGHLTTALRLIRKAKESGANAAKFQLFNPDTLYPGQHTEGSIDPAWLPTLHQEAKHLHIDLLCSVFDLDTLDEWLDTNPIGVKIASPEATDYDLLCAAASAGIPVLVSTGACTWHEVDAAHAVLADSHHALLHCVSSYPAPQLELNLAVIRGMATRYHVPVGFSDHTLDAETAPILAVAAGATIIEKHLTHNRAHEGPDHHYALQPAQFKRMVSAIRAVELMMGDGHKHPTPSENPADRRETLAQAA